MLLRKPREIPASRPRSGADVGLRGFAFVLACACGSSNVQQRLEAPKPVTARPEPVAAPPVSEAPEPARAPAPAATAVAAPAPVTAEGAIGTAHPLAVQAVSPSGNWVAFCQARNDTNGDGKLEVEIGPRGELGGDELTPLLAVGSGPGTPIDEVVAWDPTGAYVVFERAGRTVLFDTVRSTELDLDALGADTRRDALPFRNHRSIAFDPTGGWLLYLRPGRDKTEVVLRELSTGREQSYDPGPGEIWRADFEPSGRYLLLEVVRDDTDGNGRLQWPAPLAKADRPRCRGPITTFAEYEARGDRPVTVLVPRNQGAPRAVPDLVTVLGEDLVRRDADGRLLLERPSSKVSLTTDKCAGRVLHADAARGLLLVGCVAAKSKFRFDLRLVGPGFDKALGYDVAQTELDRPAENSPRVVPLYPGADTVLLDMDKRSVVRQEPGDQVLATFADRALIRRKKRLFYVGLEPASSTDLGVELAKNPDIVTQGTFAYASPWLVDLVSAKVFGPVGQRVLALSRSGQVLIAEAGDPAAERLASGPLRWITVTPKP